MWVYRTWNNLPINVATRGRALVSPPVRRRSATQFDSGAGMAGLVMVGRG